MRAASKERIITTILKATGGPSPGASAGGPLLAAALVLAFVLSGPTAALAVDVHPALEGGAAGLGPQAMALATRDAPPAPARGAAAGGDEAVARGLDQRTAREKATLSRADGQRGSPGVRADAPAGSRGRKVADGPQPPMDLSPRELRLLAQMIEAEAGAEPYVGKVAVGAVILNRVRSPLFPDTVEEVIFQPWQFEPILNGWFWREPSPESWRAARDAARGKDPTGGALYFWNPAKSGHQPHLEARPSAGWIGNHRFAY
ncbi:MAG TPA: cell wall hydrolase [Thermaerobacter sp.]